MNEPFGKLRHQIDEVDSQLLQLLNKRAALSLEVGTIKAKGKFPILNPKREKDLVLNLERLNTGPLPNEHLRRIYREIMSSSRRLQAPLTVAYLGPKGTFSYYAGVEALGSSLDYIPQRDLESVFQAVAFGKTRLGIVPFENSLNGGVGQSMDLFLRYDVSIQAETYSRISHCLHGRTQDLESVSHIFSHPQALAQCTRWLRNTVPQAELVPTVSTGAAVELALQHPGGAVIGHVTLGSGATLRCLAQDIQDEPDNWTRFLILTRQPYAGEARDKTSLLLTLPDKPGALQRVLTIFSEAHINMTKLESRPLRFEKWKYAFFIDVQADLSVPDAQPVMDRLRDQSQSLRVLGSYTTWSA
ncbi:prephenate dehydratase [Desulfoplanes formicivorans]|uniref:Bifunctional chorismate mutase/prephenate dehydratase n=1 Tax=Desulfoplanes formicivorans TaxID=1592317 RepID=A0A194AH88_9BACT|nr:prephenate dehydratase [Desulfoplanes formicivorans]GAU08451.1 chorismate mutase [Desulfoplanes formicivorans]